MQAQEGNPYVLLATCHCAGCSIQPSLLLSGPLPPATPPASLWQRLVPHAAWPNVFVVAPHLFLVMFPKEGLEQRMSVQRPEDS